MLNSHHSPGVLGSNGTTCGTLVCMNAGTCVNGTDENSANEFACNCTVKWTGENCTEVSVAAVTTTIMGAVFSITLEHQRFYLFGRFFEVFVFI